LINNAGLAGTHGSTVDGFELAFGVNHLGHYLLTRLLLPRIEASAPARIVHVSSKAHYDAKGIDFERLRQPGTTRTGLPEYSVSKLCNVLFSEELARRLDASKVSSFSLHPGVVATDVWRHAPRFAQPIMKAFMLSPEKGAATTLYCATASELEGRVGGYFDACAPRVPSRIAQDPVLAKELWDRSAAWVGLP
jgi:NAD(P)-dependent dehydrogenase (short-subunit alcohol dehydrogenase family)